MADTKAAEGSAGGTTISIAVYRSSFPIVEWNLNDDDFNLTKAEWVGRPVDGGLPKDGSPGAEVAWPEAGKPADYAEPTRAGFEFAGWSTDKSASAGGYIDGSSPALVMPEGAPESKNYTLYALWTPLEYSVIFELSKNPEVGNGPGSDASFALNWSTEDGVRTVTSLGDGRFLVEGFTMKEVDYDKATRTVRLPEPSRTGYRFLGWAEPDGQSLVIDNAAKDGFALNPVRLTQIDGTPVLAARWTSAFGVTAPLSITFGDYDKTGASGNPWLGDKGSNAADDTTQSEADDTTKSEQEGYEALGQAFFENTGWHEAIKVVGLTSERYASANQVLTTYDSKQASEAAVLGDGTEANPGERLLSLYPSASAPSDDKSSGVHFRLTDALDETALGSSFTMAPQGEKGAKLLISYGLNLSTDPTDGSANHGLVLPTNDYERKQIATVSYTFATTSAASENPEPGGFYVLDGNRLYGLGYIKQAADDLAANGSESEYYDQFVRYLDNRVPFKLELEEATIDVALIGICQDYVADDAIAEGTTTSTRSAEKAGLTFMFSDIYALNRLTNSATGSKAFDNTMNSTASFSGGWRATSLRGRMGSTLLAALPAKLQAQLVTVAKCQQGGQSDTAIHWTKDKLFIPSAFEVHGRTISGYNSSENASNSFQYQLFAASTSNIVRTYNGTANYWWTRSARTKYDTYDRICRISPVAGQYDHDDYPNMVRNGVVPCFCL